MVVRQPRTDRRDDGPLRCREEHRHALGAHEVVSVPEQDTGQPDAVRSGRRGDDCAASGEEAPELVVELVVDRGAVVRLVAQRGARCGPAYESPVDARITEASDLAVLDVVERQLLAGHGRPGLAEATGEPEHRIDRLTRSSGGQVEGPGVVEIQPQRQRRGPVEPIRVDPLGGVAVGMELVADICQAIDARDPQLLQRPAEGSRVEFAWRANRPRPPGAEGSNHRPEDPERVGPACAAHELRNGWQVRSIPAQRNDRRSRHRIGGTAHIQI